MADIIKAQDMPAELNRAVTERSESDLDREIAAFLTRYTEAYSREDYDTVLSMWDRDDPDVLYIAEEVDPPMHGWPLIDAYFNRPGTLDGVRYRFADVIASYLTPDIAIASYKMMFDLKVKNAPPMSGLDRVVVVFRKKNGDWKLARYVEAPQAPLTMIRRFAEMAGTVSDERRDELMKAIWSLQIEAVPDDFENWLAARKDMSN